MSSFTKVEGIAARSKVHKQGKAAGVAVGDVSLSPYVEIRSWVRKW